MVTCCGTYLFSMSLIHMVPELFEAAQRQGCVHHLGYYLAAGFFLQFFLDLLGGSVAHGHVDLQEQHGCMRFSAMLFVVLGLHAFLEGSLLTESNASVWLALLMHKIPVALTLAVMLRRDRRGVQLVLLLALFASITPAGALFAHYLQGAMHRYVLPLRGLAVGGLFHIATVILFESNPHHQLSRSRGASIAGGLALALLSDQFVVH